MLTTVVQINERRCDMQYFLVIYPYNCCILNQLQRFKNNNRSSGGKACRKCIAIIQPGQNKSLNDEVIINFLVLYKVNMQYCALLSSITTPNVPGFSGRSYS